MNFRSGSGSRHPKTLIFKLTLILVYRYYRVNDRLEVMVVIYYLVGDDPVGEGGAISAFIFIGGVGGTAIILGAES